MPVTIYMYGRISDLILIGLIKYIVEGMLLKLQMILINKSKMPLLGLFKIYIGLGRCCYAYI